MKAPLAEKHLVLLYGGTLYVLCILAHTDAHFFRETVSVVHVGHRIHGFPVSSETKVTDFLFPSTASRQPLAVKVTD